MKTITVLLFFSLFLFGTLQAQFGFSTSLGVAIPAGSFYTDASLADGEQLVKTGFHRHYNLQYHFIEWLGASISLSHNRHALNHELYESFLEGQEPGFDWEVAPSKFASYYLLIGPSFGVDKENYAVFLRPGIGYSIVSGVELNYELVGLEEPVPSETITARTHDNASTGLAWGASLSFVGYLTESIGLNLDARFMNADMYRRVRGEVSSSNNEPIEVYDEDAIFRPLIFTASLGVHFKF